MTSLAIRRRLTDPERSLLCRLAIETVVDQTGATWEEAVAALEYFAGRGEAISRGDFVDAYLEIAGRVLVHITRQDLALAALELEEGPARPVTAPAATRNASSRPDSTT